MRLLVQNISNLQHDQIPADKLPPASRYFVRIAPRNRVLTADNKILESAVLAAPSKPFVFLTTPEGIFGKSLLEIYEDIGYEAESIIRDQPDQAMVAILFRYPDNITLSNVQNGNLDSDWSNRIYETTWDNMLSLFPQLVQDNQSGLCLKPENPATRICLPKPDADFVLSFPAEGKLQVKTARYRSLQGIGGSDWKYRRLLEDTLSVFEHFRGDGRTENELLELRDKPDTPAQLREVVGPNMKVNRLAEVAVIDLGSMTIEGTIQTKSAPQVPSDEIVEKLKRATQEMLDAVALGDKAVWERHLAEGSIYADEEGRVLTRDELLKELRPLPAGYQGSIKVGETKSLVQEGVVVLSHVDHEELVLYGQKILTNFLTTQTWAKQKNGEWQVVSTQVMALHNERKPAAIDLKSLNSYVGQYQLAPEVTYTITREGDKLFGQRSGRDKEELLPLCVDIFYRKGSWRGEKVFQRDARGRVVALLDRRENNDLVWKKIK